MNAESFCKIAARKCKKRKSIFDERFDQDDNLQLKNDYKSSNGYFTHDAF